ncbi:MAG: hypothetical protein JXR19_11185 [Bacteroidia bacterium]
MKNSIIYSIILISFFAFSICACTDKVDDPPNINEEELITTVELTFTNDSNSNDVRMFQFADTDGVGGNEPTAHDTIRLDTNSSYTLQVRFLDESGSTVEDITEEVEEEADEHLVCYTSNGALSVSITDIDGNSLPLGLEAIVTTGQQEVTDLNVQLKHQPDVKNGSCDLGETDVEVLFRVEVE